MTESTCRRINRTIHCRFVKQIPTTNLLDLLNPLIRTIKSDYWDDKYDIITYGKKISESFEIKENDWLFT